MDLENVRSFLFKLKDGTELRLVEKDNYDKLVKRIKELEVLEDDLKDKRIAYIDTLEFKENYIPKQKVKDRIEKYKKIQEEMTMKNHNTNNINDCYKYGDEAQKAMYKREACEELLKEK